MNNRILKSAIICIFLTAPFLAAQDVLVKVDEKLQQIAGYQYGDSRETLTDLSTLFRDVSEQTEILLQIETKLDEFLQSEATFAAKQFVCKELSVFGTEKSVPVLNQLLADPETADIALYALERIPADQANIVLRDMLETAEGRVKTGIINCLGQRRDAESVALLEPLTRDSDAGISESAVAALGKIGSDKAVSVIAALIDDAGANQPVVLDAWLSCADLILAAGEPEKAFAMYEKIYNSKVPAPGRSAALRGMLHAAPDKESIMLDVLASDNKDMQTIAIGVLKELPDSQKMTNIAVELFKLAPEEQIQLLTVFGDRRDASAHDVVVRAAESENTDVRIAALRSLQDVGDEQDVVLLAQKAATSSGDEKEAARESLNLLAGQKTDATILAEIPNAEAGVKAELVRSVGIRRSADATKVLMAAATENDRTVQREAFKSLAVVAEPSDLDAILKLLMQVKNNNVRSEAEKTAVAVAQKIEKGSQSKPILDVYEKADNLADKESLLYILGRLGDSAALPVLRQALSSENMEIQKAALRALADWPGTEPMDDLLKIAKSDGDEVMQILALRGYVNLLKVPSERSDKETVELYQNAMKIAGQVNEKRLILSGLASVESPAALEAAAVYLTDAEIKAEAEVAVIALSDNVRWRNPELAAEMLKKVIKGCEDPERRKQAEEMLGMVQK